MDSHHDGNKTQKKTTTHPDFISQPQRANETRERMIEVGVGKNLCLYESLDTPLELTQIQSPLKETVNVVVKDQGQLTLMCTQEQEQQCIDRQYHITIGQNAKVTLFIFMHGGKQSTLSFHLYLEKEGACADVYGMYLVNGEQKVDISVAQHHRERTTTSTVTIHGILFEQAQTNFQGTIAIAQGAHNSNALLSNKNIVLSGRAQAKSRPCLEVLADAVRCKHGTAIGEFDEEHILYLQMRGFSENQARYMLTSAFAWEVLRHIPDQRLQEQWNEKVQRSF